MEGRWKAVAALLAAWNVILAWYGYAQGRETQRMLCHAIWKQKSVTDCQSFFTGNSLAYLIVLGVGTLLCVSLVAVLLWRRPPGAQS